MKIGTKVIHAGTNAAEQGEPFRAGVTFAGPFHAAGDPKAVPYTYGRYHNPTFTQFEHAIGELEGGTAICFASGMAAVSAGFGCRMGAGGAIGGARARDYRGKLLLDGDLRDILAAVGMQTAPLAVVVGWSRRH